MPRIVEGPWFRKGRGWHFTHGGRKVPLGVDGDTKAGRAEARKRWYAFMADPASIPAAKPARGSKAEPFVGNADTVGALTEAFLAAKAKEVAPVSLRALKDRLSPTVSKFGSVRLESLPVERFESWMRSRPGWSDTTRHAIASAIKQMSRWAEAKGLIASDPMKKLRKPPTASRGIETVLSDPDRQKFFAACSSALREVVTFMLLTACRPGEACGLTAAEVDLVNGVATLKKHKTAAKTGRTRSLPLIPEAVDLVRPLAKSRPTGPLFLTTSKVPWDPKNLARRMAVASRRSGVKVIPYGTRHTAATRMLEAGVPDAHVAAVLGHTSTAMIHRHYSHVGENVRLMQAAAASLASRVPAPSRVETD